MSVTSSNTSQPLAKRALSAHSVFGLAISAVLYIICLSGTVIVFKDEIKTWEQRGEPRVEQMSASAVQAMADNGLAAAPETGHLILYLPTDNILRARVQAGAEQFYVDAQGEVSVASRHKWSDFLFDLHYYLHLPHSFGMLVVAIFGVFLFGMSVSGFLAHPSIFKDAFAFRRSKSEQIKQTDLHNRLSVWTSPFHITNSLTGAIIGLSVLSALALGNLKYEGNMETVFEPIYGTEPTANEAPAPMANVEKALNYMAQHFPDIPPNLIIVHEPGTKGQFVQVYAQHTRRLIYAEKYNFDGKGTFLGATGSADGQWGQQAYDSIYKVHFGSFGGLPVKIAFVIFGICLMYIITAGMNIYFIKRQSKGRAAPKLQRAWKGLVFGAPVMLMLTLVLAMIWPAGSLSLAAVFWFGVGAMSIGFAVRNVAQ
ncbi:MAG: peptidase [Alphaproteobacteria bacterium]|nr:MAG: peptidase [Alphaproteobacteria bacterium]